MKLTMNPFGAASDPVVRPGFDVLMAVTGARQAASPTAQRVAANQRDSASGDEAALRRGLLVKGRLCGGSAAASVSRFAEIAPIRASDGGAVEEVAMEMNGLFTRAFQAMVKYGDVKTQDMAGGMGCTGPGME
jgi:hypothetical protein